MDTEVTNTEQLVNELCRNYAEVKAGKLKLKEAKELANTAGKIINACRTQLMYNVYMGVKAPIKFLDMPQCIRATGQSGRDEGAGSPTKEGTDSRAARDGDEGAGAPKQN